MNLYELFILDVNTKYIVFAILYRHINVTMACKELICQNSGKLRYCHIMSTYDYVTFAYEFSNIFVSQSCK